MAASTFFNSSYTLEEIQDAWMTRSKELEEDKLQAHNDLLYAYLSNDILARRYEIHRELLHAIQTAHSRTELRIPLWTFTAVHFTEKKDNYHELLRGIRDLGGDWTISSLAKEKQSIWNVVKKTDICQRLALLFGDNFYVNYSAASFQPSMSGNGWYCLDWNLVLQFYPNAIWMSQHCRYRLDVTSKKYATRISDADTDTPHVGTGANEAEFPMTPPTLTRSNCTGISEPSILVRPHRVEDPESESDSETDELCQHICFCNDRN